jgi:hypothetical protein
VLCAGRLYAPDLQGTDTPAAVPIRKLNRFGDKRLHIRPPKKRHIAATDEMDKRFFRTSQIRGDLPQVCSLVRPRRRRSFVPTPISQPPRTGAVKAGRILRGHPRLGLDRPEHGGMLDRIGIAKARWLTATGALGRDWN